MKQPPKFWSAILEWYCREHSLEEVLGDLEESYHLNAEDYGLKYARRTYIKEVLHLFRPKIIKKFKIHLTSTAMIKNYFKIALRTLRREPGYAFLNILGLTIGITSSVLIFQYTNFESSYDQQHPDVDNTYRLRNDVFSVKAGRITNQRVTTFMAVHPGVSEEIPEVEKSTHFFSTGGIIETKGEPFRVESVFYTPTNTLDIFDIPLLTGNKSDLDEIGSLFLSKSQAQRIFGSTDVIGERIVFLDFLQGNPRDLEVKGVFEDIAENNHLKADALISMSTRISAAEASGFGNLTLQDVVWRWSQFYTYIQAVPGTDAKLLEEKVNQYMHKYRQEHDERSGRNQSVVLQPIRSIHLQSNFVNELEPPGNQRVVSFLKAIAFLLIVIAWINYINLANARALNRAKEVSVRKVMGALRGQLGTQFLMEGLLFNLIAILLSIGLIVLIIPSFHQMVEIDVFDYMGQHQTFWLAYFGFLLVGSLFSGLYPTYFLTRKSIVDLKSKLSHSSFGILMRKSLVGAQIMIAVGLTSALFIINSQIKFMVNHNLGFNIDQTLVLNSQPFSMRDSTYFSAVSAFRNTLLSQASIQDITISSLVPGKTTFWNQSARLSGDDQNRGAQLGRISADFDYFDYFDFDMVAGRSFSKEFKGDANVIVVNKKAAELLGFDDPEEILDKELAFISGDSWRVIGVVDNFFQQGLRYEFSPFAISLDTTNAGGFISMRVNTGNGLAQTLATVESNFKETFPGAPFDYFFLDDDFNAQYNADRLFQKNFALFTMIAVLISCLGLIGMSTFMINQKSKEVSIRKVFGASGSQLFYLLTKDYGRLVLIAGIVAIPSIYYLSQQWLDNFAFKVGLHVWMFLLPLVVVALIILVTISRQMIKTMMVNPAKLLREE